MSEQKRADASALTIPEQSPPAEDAFLLNPKAVRRWAKELPVANIGETARQVYNTLVEFNRTRIPTLVRTEVVELFREPTRYITKNISKHYAHSGFPLSSKARKAAQLSNALCAELANSYKILFLDQLQADERHFNQKLIIVAAQRAILYLNERMLHTQLVYRDYPANLWREANYLYAWAMQNQVEEVPVRESRGFSLMRDEGRTIESVYKSMTVMATVNPHRLRQSQLRRLHARIEQWALLAQLRPAWQAPDASGVFFINLWSDSPPMRHYSGMSNKDARFLALDLNPVIQVAREEFEQAQWESPAYLETPEAPVSRTVLKPLIRHWSKAVERKFPRTETRDEIETVVGLSNLMRLLDKRQREAAEAARESERPNRPQRPGSSRLTWNDSVFSTLSINAPSLSLEGDTTSMLSEPGLGSGPGQSGAGAQPRESIFDRNVKEPETLFTVLTYNQSVEGYCLAWNEQCPTRIRVGDVLGIRSAQNPEEFGVGITRWLRQDMDNKVYIGLQLLATSCIRVMVSPEAKASANRQNQYRCLLLSTADSLRTEHSLLTNTHVFDVDSVVTMTTDFGTHRIRLTRWLESNNNFVQYQFEYLDEPKPTSSQVEDDEFKDIWNEL